MKWKNLLPNDTRIVELASAISLFLASIIMLYQGNTDLFHSNSMLFFSVILGAFQFISLVFLDKIEAFKVTASLIMGAFLMYVGFVHIGNTPAISYITQITLGCANLYAFLVNNQRLVWK